MSEKDTRSPARETVLQGQPEEACSLLLVDDEKGIRTVMGISLRDAGYTVATAESGEAALQLFAEKPFPIVLTDIRMPGISGLELLRQLKQIAPETEVILVSGHADLEMAIQGLKLEASDFITKPVNDELLLVALQRARARLVMRDQLREHTASLEALIREKSAQLIEAERKLAARQAVDGFAVGLRALSSVMAGDQQAFNELPCFIAVHDRDMQIITVNDLYRERLGNLVGHPSWEPYITNGEQMLPVERAIREGRGSRSEQILRGKNGTEIPVLVHTAPILNNDGEIELVLELSVDELESRRLREELRLTRERFRQLFEESPCHIAVIDNDHRIREANRAFRKTFGAPGGKQCHEVFAGSSTRCEDCPMQDSTDTTGQVEKVVLDQQGRPLTMLVWTTPLRDTSGTVREFIEMSVDISELRQLQDRLSSLGLLMGSTAHGIKGMLTALDGTVYRIGSGIAKGDAGRIADSLKDLRQMVAKLRKLVLDILYFSKERQLEMSRIDPVELVRSVVATVADRARESGVLLEVQAEKAADGLEADGAILHAALVNLAENAIDACCADSKTPHQVCVAVRRLQEQIEFRITDNGTGMPEEIRAKLFTLFFSSKGSGGTGIGLYVSRQIVLQHAGRIDVESTLGQGSTFIVTIPGAVPCGSVLSVSTS